VFKKSTLKDAREWFFSAIISLSIFLSIYCGGFRPANINGESMEPTFNDSDRCVVWVSAYWFKEPDYGDVIVFPYPSNEKEKYIKRVVGKGGDVIDFIDWAFYVNGEIIENGQTAALGDVTFPLTVPNGSVFVLGDNRDVSKDSRYSSVGCLPSEDIIGKVILRFWPLKKAGVVD
jgi:signal peptidase I